MYGYERIKIRLRNTCEMFHLETKLLPHSDLRGGGFIGETSRSRRHRVAGACECGNEPSGSIKRGEFLD
jgi:hypothetical protein